MGLSFGWVGIILLADISLLFSPRLKQLSYSRKLLIEERTLAKSAFGHVILARTPSSPLKRRLGLAGNGERLYRFIL